MSNRNRVRMTSRQTESTKPTLATKLPWILPIVKDSWSSLTPSRSFSQSLLVVFVSCSYVHSYTPNTQCISSRPHSYQRSAYSSSLPRTGDWTRKHRMLLPRKYINPGICPTHPCPTPLA
ncbi:hypothetical protein CPC08DRAFT_217141 [Agrocybe pediades]|nr:hypothetical protein CPC08DRAFT_217141 [Agrocybe pediades]